MNKRAIIIGATSGIGREMALLLMQQGWNIGVAGRRGQLLEELKALNPERVATEVMDVTAEDAEERLHRLISKMGGMELFLLCSGVGAQNVALDAEVELRTVRTNVEGFVRMTDAAFNYFKQQGGGHIAAISSVAGTKGLGVASSYSASKRFQNHYLDALEQLSYMNKYGITFTDIRPGFVKTALLNVGKNRYPMLMTPEVVARKAVRAIEKKKRVAVIDGRYALLVALWRLIPAWLWKRLPIKTAKK